MSGPFPVSGYWLNDEEFALGAMVKAAIVKKQRRQAFLGNARQ
jgi:hypothetical protein